MNNIDEDLGHNGLGNSMIRVASLALLALLLTGLMACGTLELEVAPLSDAGQSEASNQAGIGDIQPASEEERTATAVPTEISSLPDSGDEQPTSEEEATAVQTEASSQPDPGDDQLASEEEATAVPTEDSSQTDPGNDQLASEEEATVVPAESPAAGSQTNSQLPAPVYFLNAEDDQIWRVEVDGVSLTQVTSEEAPVTDFDASPADGALAYISDNQLIYATLALGGRRQVLIPGAEDYDDSDYISLLTKQISNPIWSPDGTWIAFSEGGVQLYQDPAAPRQEGHPEVWVALYNDPLPDPLPGDGDIYEGPQNLYRPMSWLPDGKHILVEGGYYFALGRFKTILDIETGSHVGAEEPKGIPCCSATWGQESGRLLYSGHQPGIYQSGLWRVDPGTGESVALVPGEAGGEYHLFAYPFEISPDRVYGFYNSEPVSINPGPIPFRPLVMVSVAADGSAELEPLREDYLVVGEAAWLPDGSGAVITDVAGNKDWPRVGILRWLPSDGSPAVTLPARGRLPHWGFRPGG